MGKKKKKEISAIRLYSNHFIKDCSLFVNQAEEVVVKVKCFCFFIDWAPSKLRKLQENVCTPGIKEEFLVTKISTDLKILKLRQLLNLEIHILLDFVSESQMFCERL